MKKVIRYQSADGSLHETIQDAEIYTNNRYGLVLCALSKKLVSIEKYNKMGDFIDSHLQEFLELKKLKDDILLENPEEEDDD